MKIRKAPARSNVLLAFVDWLLALFSPGFRKGSRHNEAIVIYVFQWIILGAAAIFVSYKNEQFGLDDSVVTVIGGVATIMLGVMQSAAIAENKRMGVVDFFMSDILSICSVVYSMDLPQRYVQLHLNPSLPSVAPGKEDYLNVYRDQCRDLVVLDPEVVRNVTAFYRYFMGSRDAAAKLAQTVDVAARRRGVEVIMIQLGLCLCRARDAIRDMGDGEYLSGAELIDEMLMQCRIFYLRAGIRGDLLMKLDLLSA